MIAPSVPAQTIWVSRESNSPEYLGGVAHGNGTYVAVGDAGVIVTSPDAVLWSSAESTTTESLRAVTFAEGVFVAVGRGGTIVTSPDGSTWTPRVSGVSAFLSGVAHGEGRFVAVGGGGGTIVTSPDGVTWNLAEDSGSSGTFLQGVIHANGLFMATGFGSILTSGDGSSWEAQSLPPAAATGIFLAGGYFAGRYYAMGLNGVMVSSSDGVVWSLGSSGTLNGLWAFGSDGTSAIVCGDGGTLLHSKDGTTWTPVASGQLSALTGTIFGDGRFVVVGEPGEERAVILTSERDPGILWGASEVVANEAAGSVSLVVERLGPTDSPASVAFQTLPGTAAGNVDFIPVAGTAQFAVGESEVQIEITLVNNPEAEMPESFSVVLSSPDPSETLLYNPHAATVHIVDAQDGDFDGLPDDWEILHFGEIHSFGPGDDPDGDGNDNERELADGTDPDDTESANYQLAVGVGAGEGSVSVLPELAVYPRGTMITLTPLAIGEYSFLAWQGDASGAAAPLVLEIASDLAIEALFEISLAHALDSPCLSWTVSGSGSPWSGQDEESFEGGAAASAGGLVIGEQSILEATVQGPAELSFAWRVSGSQFDSLRFFIDGSPRANLTEQTLWETGTFLIGGGEHTLRWVYAKNSSLVAGENRAWLDQVSLDYHYDHWVRAYFNTLEQIDPAIAGAGADADLDGITNLLEHLFDLRPKFPDNDSPNLPSISVLESGGQELIAVTWSQHRKRADNLEITVEFSDSLEVGSWQTLSVPVEVLAEAGAMQTVRVVDPVPFQSKSRGFYRLKVVLPQP